MAKLTGLSEIATSRAVGPPPWTPSAQQQAIFDYDQRPTAAGLIVEARAGSGKTSTLVELCRHVQGQTIFLAFNKAIATEIGQKLAVAGVGREVRSATFHSVGFQAWARHMPAAARNVRAEKLAVLCQKHSVPQYYVPFVKRAVSLAKQSLIGALPDLPADDEEVWLTIVEHFDLMDLMPDTGDELDAEEWLATALAWSLKLLKESNLESASMIDFEDMIYMPLYAQLRFQTYDRVLVDEAQDTNRGRREIAARLLRPGGRLIAVGDRFQAIYGFTGANADALDLIEQDFSCEILPLTTTYRCPRKVVELAQTWVPDIEPRDGAPDGEVRRVDAAKFALAPPPGAVDAILCRNTKPIVKLAFHYLRKHVACHVEGREIGAALTVLIRRFKIGTIHELSAKLHEYLDAEREKLLASHRESKLIAIEDKVSTIQVLAQTFNGMEHPEKLTALISRLFKDSDGLERQTLTLSTIHKAKGREWNNVYILGRNTLMPSPYATQPWELQQEMNLAYVAVTRAKQTLTDIDLPERGK